MELKRINMETGKFTANGVDYAVNQYLSIERYCEFQILEKELGYGFSFAEIYKNLDHVEQLLNKTQFVPAAVMINNIKQGVVKVQEREPVMLKMCTLFINYEGEDIRTFTNDMIDKKITDWKAEGIAMNDFFTVALNSINGFFAIYQNITRNITEILSEQPAKQPVKKS